MYNRIVSLLFCVMFCLFTFVASCVAADNVVVIPVGNSLFKGDQYLTIPGIAFTPDYPTTDYEKPWSIYTNLGYVGLITHTQTLVAPVILPDGAIVSQISTYVERKHGNCYLTFSKRTLENRQFFMISDTTTMYLSYDQYTAVNVDIASEKVDNKNYQYSLDWGCGSLPGYVLDRLYAVRIKYRLR